MRTILKALLELLSAIYIEFKKAIWPLRTKLFSEHKIKVYKNNSYHLSSYGELTKMLYCNSHLTPFNRGFEAETLEIFERSIMTGDIVLDIGANVGLFSLLGSELVGERGRIYAFEPAKDTLKALTRNIEINRCKNVEISSELSLIHISEPTRPY